MAYIHSDEIGKTTHWSFGDLDLCYGDLRFLLSAKNLNKYKLITTHNYHIAGHFTVMRNNEYFRNLCFAIPGWKEKLENPINIAVDEIYWSNLVFPALKYSVYLYRNLLKKIYVKCWNSWLTFCNKLFKPHYLFKEYYTSPEPKVNELWIYDRIRGKVFDSQNRELPYIHFLFFKSHPIPEHPTWDKSYYRLDKPIQEYSRILISTESVKGQ